MMGDETMSESGDVRKMRIGKFGDITLLGSQYRDESGQLHWYVAMFSDHDPNVRIHHLLGGEIPGNLQADEMRALIEAITRWESEPAPPSN
jgi:hypothetical protein